MKINYQCLFVLMPDGFPVGAGQKIQKHSQEDYMSTFLAMRLTLYSLLGFL
jgi:hypothetical protein